MTYYTFDDLLAHRKGTAMRICGIFDETEVGEVSPISYIEYSGQHTFATVWMFGNKKIFSAMFELIPGDYQDPAEPHGAQFFDIYRFKNVDDIRVDDFGCIIALRSGKKLELKSNAIEGKDNFNFSAHGLVSLWDSYAD
jgi:hypothetical protein